MRQEKLDKECFFLEVSVGDLLKYNYLFSNELYKCGIIVKIKKDYNFGFMLHILSNKLIEQVPYSIIEFDKL